MREERFVSGLLQEFRQTIRRFELGQWLQLCKWRVGFEGGDRPFISVGFEGGDRTFISLDVNENLAQCSGQAVSVPICVGDNTLTGIRGDMVKLHSEAQHHLPTADNLPCSWSGISPLAWMLDLFSTSWLALLGPPHLPGARWVSDWAESPRSL